MKWITAGFAGLALLSMGAGTMQPAPATSGQDAAVKRGAYLVRTSGCKDCHTPKRFDAKLGMPVPDMKHALSGHPANGPEPEGTVGRHDIGLIGPTFTAFKLPFGTVYSANLTPDPDTGLGRWTVDQFIAAMRTGKHMGAGAPILPPMPWQEIGTMTDDDLRAIFAYLQSVPAVKNPVPAAKVPPPVMSQMAKTNAQLVQMMQSHKP